MPTSMVERVLQNATPVSVEEVFELDGLIEKPKSIEELAAEQGVGLFDFKAALEEAAGIWPEDESADDFNAAVREWRREGSPKSFA